MKIMGLNILFGTIIMILCSTIYSDKLKENIKDNPMSLKAAYNGKFLIGVALNLDLIEGVNNEAVKIVKTQFNSIVAENLMKSTYLQPQEGKFYFKDADRFVSFGEKNDMHIVGHTLIWHSQTPDWFFTNEEGKYVSREILIERMRDYIYTVVSRYKGRVQGWDVVNEAILDNGEYRKSKFYEIIGEDYISLAFQFAKEADPTAELYYNDYSTFIPAKRAAIVNLIKKLQSSGIKIDAVGIQGHYSLNYPSIKELERAITAFAELDINIMITELDVSVLPYEKPDAGAEIADTLSYNKRQDPYRAGMPSVKLKELSARYLSLFKLYLKYESSISRVTFWGVGDADSWRNDWPIKGRTDYPLIFDRDYQPKMFVPDLIKLGVSWD